MEGHVSKVAEKHQPIYEIRDLKCSYGDAFTLLIPSLMIERGDSVGIIGPNGSGKKNPRLSTGAHGRINPIQREKALLPAECEYSIGHHATSGTLPAQTISI